jgi:protein-tyrosine sulfotransferase
MLNPNRSAPIFIVGVPRSGTTLLRVMLDSHPNLAVGPECPWIGGSYGDLTSFRDLYQSLVTDRRGPIRNFEGITEAHVAEALGKAIAGILDAYALARGKQRWLEKTPNHIADIPFIVKLFPRCKFIHIVRDGRDVACSSFAESVTWGGELYFGEKPIPNTRLNALLRWCSWLSQFQRWAKELNLEVCQIQYESLIAEPRPTLEKILRFIEEPWSDLVFAYQDHDHDLPDWEAGSRDVSQKLGISQESIGRWKREFTAVERSMAASMADHLLLKLGYESTLIERGAHRQRLVPIRVRLIRTDYPHLSDHSGLHQFVNHLQNGRFQIDVQLVSMGKDHFQVHDEGLQRELQTLVRKNGVKAYDLNDLVAEFNTFRQWLNGGFDLLHYLDGEHSLQYLPLVFCNTNHLKRRPPIIATFHQPPAYLHGLINPEIVQLLDRVHVMSPEQAAFFGKYLPKSKIALILHGVDVDYFRPSMQPRIDGKFRCISVGSWMRDYETVFAVADMVHPYPEIEFHVVADSVENRPSQTNVHVYHGIDDAALLNLYQQSDLLFLPLLNAVANNAILEAMACGLPVVSSDLAAVRAYVPGMEAVLVSGNDPEGFSNVLIRLCENVELRRQMSSLARQRAVALAWTHTARHLESLYSEALSD